MRAIILAAGRGSRMGGLTEETPKCLVQLAGRALLEWQTTALEGAGIAEIGIVTGWQAEKLGKRGLPTFHNARWSETNMVMSLMCASEWLRMGTCIVSYSDIFYPVSAVVALASAKGDIAISYDPDWLPLWSARFADPLADAESFQLDSSGFVKDIGRRVESVEAIAGQYVGLLKFSPGGWERVTTYLGLLPQQERDRLDMTGLLRRLIGEGVRVGAVPVGGPWGEVDSASDLSVYEGRIRKGVMPKWLP